ncbi:MAG: GNAT family N-acetyltransferase [Saprospiraceae bacterium]|nr:GNAT family N-acetyltransferase [Saprospiraceae bacterium]
MKLLATTDYFKCTESLKEVKINTLFAISIVQQKLQGKIYVDDTNKPSTFYIIHPYGMSLLFGNYSNNEFNLEFLNYALNHSSQRERTEWIQAFPWQWDLVLKELFGDNLITSKEAEKEIIKRPIELNTRLNFAFNEQKFRSQIVLKSHEDVKIVRTNSDHLKSMIGTVTPLNFWNNETDFLTNGIGYSVLFKDKLAAIAFSAFIQDNFLEIGIETMEEFKGKGFAFLACSTLINYSLENSLIPVWACRLENYGSYKLAEKLGFEISLRIQYYKINL